jgi:hypothetical protein
MLAKSVIAFGVMMSLSSIAHAASTYNICMSANGFSTQNNSYCYKNNNGQMALSNCCVSNPNAGTVGFAQGSGYKDAGAGKCAGLTAKATNNGYTCSSFYQKN